MPQVYCLEWLDDDPDLGMREDGCSLHLTKADASAFAAERRSYSCVPDPEGAYEVEVPADLYQEVRSSRNGIRRTLPREPRFPRPSRLSQVQPLRPTPPTVPRPPGPIEGRYRLTAPIPGWGWGEAFSAVDMHTDAPYTLKIGARSDWAPVFRRAHEALVAVGHAAFVSSVGFGRLDDGRPYLVEEPIQGATLPEVTRDGPLSPTHALDLATTVAEGLSAAHRAGVFWLDVAPGKAVLPCRDGRTHFSGPRLVDSLLSNGHIIAQAPVESWRGTLGGVEVDRLSPEEIRGRGLGPETDVYRLGALCYYALAGRPPFVDDTVAASLYRIVHDEAVFPEGSPVPEPLQQLVLRCLRVDPAARLPDGEAVLQAMLDVRRRLTSSGM